MASNSNYPQQAASVAPKTLLDVLRSKMTAPEVAPGPQLGQTEQVQNLLRTKLTGKSQEAGAQPSRYNAAEIAAAEQGKLTLGTQLQQGRLQAAELAGMQAGQEQDRELQRQQYSQSQQLRKQAFNTQTSGLLHDFEVGNRKLDNARDIADMEQIGFAARLENKKYVDQLAQEGARSRLDNDLKFKEAYYQQVFKDAESILKNDIEFAKTMGQTDREFKVKLAAMDINSARDLAKDALKAANVQATYSGVGQMASGVLQGVKAYKTPTTTTDNSKSTNMQAAMDSGIITPNDISAANQEKQKTL